MVVQNTSNVDVFSFVRNNEVKSIEALQPGFDLNVKQHGQTALILAIQEKKETVINVLLEKGADPNITDESGKSSLAVALEFKLPVKIIQLLIDKGASPNLPDLQNKEPIHICVESSNSATLSALLSAPKVKLNTMFEGDTCLAILCLRIQNLLPGLSPDLNLKDDDVDEVPSMFRMLLEKGADPNIGFALKWTKKSFFGVIPLGFFARALIHLEAWSDQLEYKYQTKVMYEVCSSLARSVLPRSNLEARFDDSSSHSILEVIVQENLGVLVGNDTVQKLLEEKWGPPLKGVSFRFKTFISHLSSRRLKFILWFSYYIVFLSLFTQVAFNTTSQRNNDIYFFSKEVNGVFLSGDVPFTDIATWSDFWTWTNALKEGIYKNESYIVGDINLRQFRFDYRNCRNPSGIVSGVNSSRDACRMSWSLGRQNVASFGDGDEFTYRNPTFTQWTFSYPTDGGFVAKIPTHDYELTQKVFSQLQNSSWIDEKTSLLIMETILYDSNVDLVLVARLVLDVSPIGYISSYIQLDPIRFPYFLDESIWAFEIALAALWLFSFLVELKQLASGITVYITDRWNFLDLLLHSLMICIWVIRVLRHIGESKLNLTVKTDIVPSFVKLSELYNIEINCWAFTSLIVYSLLFKFIRVFSQMGILLRVVRKMIINVLIFLILFLIIQLGFSLAFHILLPSRESFHTWSLSLGAIIRILIGDLSFSEVLDSGRYFAIVLFLGQVLTSTILLLNLLIAMLNQSFTDIIAKATLEYKIEQASIILSYGNQGIKFPKNSRVTLQEDKSEIKEKVATTESSNTNETEEINSNTKTVEKLEEQLIMFKKETDTNGIIYTLGPSRVKVSPSSTNKGDPKEFVSKSPTPFLWTKNEKNAFFAVDLGKGVSVCTSHYTMRYGSSGNYCCPRNWLLQGANDADALKVSLDISPKEDRLWKTLSTHENDESLDSEHQIKLFACNSPTEEYYRYFRIVQHDKNKFKAHQGTEDGWSLVLVACGFELFGKMKRVVTVRSNKSSDKVNGTIVNYSKEQMPNGIITQIIKPANVRVYCSRIGTGRVEDFLAKGDVHVWTKNEPNSWFAVDIGNYLSPTEYSLKYASSGNFCCPRNWILQGTNDLEALNSRHPNPMEDPAWTTLSIHKNDSTLNKGYHLASFKVTEAKSDKFFKIFRIIQTGHNVYIATNPKEDNGWSQVLVASGFDLWGDLKSISQKNEDKIELPYTNNTSKDIISKIGPLKVKVFGSPVAQGKADDFINQTDNVSLWTTNARQSWLGVDFGEDIGISPTHYTIKYSSSGEACCLRNWEFQGTNDLNAIDNPNSSVWTVLDTRVKDATINGEFQSATFKVQNVVGKFRMFRILQTEKNKLEGNTTWENVLVCGGFKIFGTLYEMVEKESEEMLSPKAEKTEQTTTAIKEPKNTELLDAVEEIKKEQEEKLKLVRFTMEKVVSSLQEELNQMELRLDMKMKIIKDEVRKQAKLTLVLK